VNYREAYGLYACNGILFNHESPRRGETFVTRKITLAAARISQGKQKTVALGNLNAKRDWGYAPEFVEGMWQILQQDKPEDYVLATGETHTVREFAELAFREVGIELGWRGEGLNEQGVSKKDGNVIIEIDPKYYRPSEVDLLVGDPSKATKKLGWKAKTRFEDLVRIMVKADVERVAKKGY
jgi:GDPmannose 4,6-dehydratase